MLKSAQRNVSISTLCTHAGKKEIPPFFWYTILYLVALRYEKKTK